MRDRRWVTIGAIVFAAAMAAPAAAQDFPSWAGRWQGRLGGEMGIVIELTQTAPKTWEGTANVAQAGAFNRALTGIAIDGYTARFTIPDLRLGADRVGSPAFIAEMRQDGLRMSGEATDGDDTRPFMMDRLGALEGWSATGIEGYWMGTLKVGVIELRLGIEIFENADGKLIGNLDSLDQGSMDIVFDSITREGSSLSFGVNQLQASYRGTIAEGEGRIEGVFTQLGQARDLAFEKLDRPPSLRRPQEPEAPYPYREEEVTYENAGAGITIAGTLTIPEGEGPHPATILISGSGAQDRDESLMGHRPFFILADRLTRAGVAVLRFDDRGVGGTGGDTMQATLEDTVTDVFAGVEYLKDRPEIDGARIGLLGHSEGGWVAPMAAVESDDIAFIVLMAGPGVSGEEILLSQSEAILRASGESEALISATQKIARATYAIVKEQTDPEVARPLVEAMEEELLAELPEEERLAVEEFQARQGTSSEAVIAAQLRVIFSPWFKYLLSYDPRPTLTAVTCPVLAVIGEKDLQVPPELNIPILREALEAGGNADATVRELPGLNHLLQRAETGLMNEYGRIEETIDEAALELFVSWIVERTGG